MNKRFALQAGLTLMEVLIGITLSGFIFLSVTSLILVLFTSNARVSQKDIVEQAKNDIETEISHTLRWAKTINISAGAEITATAERGNIQYTLVNNQLLKNGVPVTSSEIKITNFSIKNHSQVNEYKSLELIFELEHARFSPIKNAFRVVVSQRFGSQS